jgi:hypothetical protein
MTENLLRGVRALLAILRVLSGTLLIGSVGLNFAKSGHRFRKRSCSGNKLERALAPSQSLIRKRKRRPRRGGSSTQAPSPGSAFDNSGCAPGAGHDRQQRRGRL